MTSDAADAPDAPALVGREIAELHEVFEAWLDGVPPAGDPDGRDLFGRIERALADGFTMVTTAGRLVERGSLLERLRAGRGRRPGLEILTAETTLRQRRGAVLLATYQEWQRAPGEAARGRLSSVLFARDDDAPNGLVWLHVHETWLPDDARPPAWPSRRGDR